MFGFLKNKKMVEVYSPLDGEIISVTEVNDPVFSEKMIGDGFAVKPAKDQDTIKAPIDGEIIQVFPTYHAIGLKTAEGMEILIHIGLDTVELKGEGFHPLVKPGQKVKRGEPMMEVDFQKIREKGKDTVTPVIFTSPIKELEIFTGDDSEIAAEVRV